MKAASVAIVVALAAIFGLSPAFAETEGAPTSGAPTAAAVEPATIDGYRSARFGMTEAEVKKAIKADLSVDDPAKAVNAAERTSVLIVAGRNLIPDSPPAAVSYILGATTAKLIQVNIVWGEKGGADAKQIVPIANALATYFLDKGSYAKDSVAVNQNLPDGTVLVFRGADAKGRMVVLQLTPIIDPAEAKKATKDKPVELKKATLKLSYVANPTKPDVFRIEKGRF